MTSFLWILNEGGSASGFWPAGCASAAIQNPVMKIRPPRSIDIIISPWQTFLSSGAAAPHRPEAGLETRCRTGGLPPNSSLDAAGAAALRQSLDLVRAEAVVIPWQRMLQTRCGDRELQRLLVARESLEPVDQPGREGVASSHAVHDVRDLVVPADQETLAVVQAGRPPVVGRASRCA